jgi:phosphate transport system ATP-binding protein
MSVMSRHHLRKPAAIADKRVREHSRTARERMRLEDVSVYYDRLPAVKNVSFSVPDREIFALIGPSGCGKTTLLRTLNRLTELTPNASHSGNITLDGENIFTITETALRTRVSMIFQQPTPFPMSVFDNVAFALREQSRKRPLRSQIQSAVEDALTRVGLAGEVALNRPALTLSGGQQQRLCIARALITNPEILLLDEPCSALDPHASAVVEELLLELRRDHTLILITHNLQQAHRLADRVAFMYLGDLIEIGSTNEIFETPRCERTREYIAGVFG